jgi:hypothetical protein
MLLSIIKIKIIKIIRMEIYKLRYNLYNYIFDNDIDYKLLIVSKNISKYFLIAIFIIFIIIILSDTSKISYIIFFFILFGIILIYLTFIIDNTFDIIKNDKKFLDYSVYFRLFNCIFIDSYKNNDIPIYIKDDAYPKIEDKTITELIIGLIEPDSNKAIDKNKYYNTGGTLASQPTKLENLNAYNEVKKINSIFSMTEFTAKQFDNYNIDVSFENDEFHYYNNYVYSDIPTDFTEYLKFKSGVSYLYLNKDLTVDILIVGGGGGGAIRTEEFKFGGGGGGGQVIYNRDISLPKGFYEITVGNGGGIGANGDISLIKKRDDTSTAASKPFVDLYSAGGGGAGFSSITQPETKSGTGGGGGGNSYKSDLTTPGGKANTNGRSPKSADGGQGKNVSGIGYLGGGGGGGIGGYIGQELENPYNPIDGIQGNGGIGSEIDITGTVIGYGGGGGGGRYVGNSIAGYGGGNGGGYYNIRRSYYSINPIAGTPNTGGGGGGYCFKISGQQSAPGGSGVVIIRFKKQSVILNNIYIPKDNPASSVNNSIIITNTSDILDEINIVKFIITTPSTNQYNIYVEYLKNKDITIGTELIKKLNELYNKICEYVNEYYNVYSDVIELLEISTLVKSDYKYLYSINLNKLEKKKDKSSILNNLYKLLKEYFISRCVISGRNTYTLTAGTNKFENILKNVVDSSYLNNFYTTLMEINTNIKYNDNIGKDDIYTYSEELIKSNSILKYINVNNDNKYKILKKWIFIKIDEDNSFHKEIKDNYTSNKDKYIDEIDKINKNIRVSNVIIDISSIYITDGTLKYFLIDIETINEVFGKKNKDTDKYNLTINQYVSNIYNTLLDNYNHRIDLNTTIENFDILFNVNKDIDKEINILIDNFLYYYNLIIIIVVIIMTIILHIFYIELFRLI